MGSDQRAVDVVPDLGRRPLDTEDVRGADQAVRELGLGDRVVVVRAGVEVAVALDAEHRPVGLGVEVDAEPDVLEGRPAEGRLELEAWPGP